MCVNFIIWVAVDLDKYFILEGPYICIFEHFFLRWFWHKDSVKLKFLYSSRSFYTNGVLVWWFDTRIVALSENK